MRKAGFAAVPHLFSAVTADRSASIDVNLEKVREKFGKNSAWLVLVSAA